MTPVFCVKMGSDTRSLGACPSTMNLVPTRDALRLTGLSPEQLREWTSRRALIQPDMSARGHGSSARYSWQTILILRIAVVLRDRFKMELQANKDLFANLASSLRHASFLSLWGKSLVLHGQNRWELVDAKENEIQGDCLILRLDRHLDLLSAEFSLPVLIPPGQFALFPASGISKKAGARGVR